MGEHSKIEWTDTTWNPLAGCTPVSAGCRNCYAANHARRLAGNPHEKVRAAYEGTARTAGDGRAVFTGRVNLLPDRLEEPLRWRKPRRVFVNAMSDLFHEDVPFDFVDRVFAVMARSPRHTFQILTKRPERMAEYLNHPESAEKVARLIRDEDAWVAARLSNQPWPSRNVWLGTSVEDQAAADERIPHLLRCPAAVRFLSCEPLLEAVDLRDAMDFEGIHWVIAGGESGPGARPCDVAWLRSLRDQCQAAGVPFFWKQSGASHRCQHDSKGGCIACAPPDLTIREFPHAT